MRKIAINLETQKRNASRSLPVMVHKSAWYFDCRFLSFNPMGRMETGDLPFEDMGN